MKDKNLDIEHIHTCLRALLKDYPSTEDQKRLVQSIMKQVKQLKNMEQ